jgi:hypothetical protein
VGERINFCLFCGLKFGDRILRHLVNKHPDSEQVQEFLKLPKRSKQRRRITTKLRNLGNYNHNLMVEKAGTGLLITARGSKNKDTIDFANCIRCLLTGSIGV